MDSFENIARYQKEQRLAEIAEALRASRIAAMSIDELKAECEELEWFDLFLNGNGKGEPRGTLRP